MHPPEPSWECDYAHDRRKHRHRCMACNRIIDAGERVIQCRRLGDKGVKSIHLACGARWHTSPEIVAYANHPTAQTYTWAQAFQGWGVQRLIAIGWPRKHFAERDIQFSEPCFKATES